MSQNKRPSMSRILDATTSIAQEGFDPCWHSVGKLIALARERDAEVTDWLERLVSSRGDVTTAAFVVPFFEYVGMPAVGTAMKEAYDRARQRRATSRINRRTARPKKR